MQQLFKEETSIPAPELEASVVKGFVSPRIFRILLIIGISCSATGFFVDIFMESIPRMVIIMTVSLGLYLSLLLALIPRLDLLHNMRLAVLGVMTAILIELAFDDGGILWSMVIAPIAFAAFGKKEGFIWTIANFIVIAAWLIWGGLSVSHFSYTAMSNIIMTYIVITSVSYFYTSHIEHAHQLILEHVRKQERLEIAQTLSGGMAHLINNEMQVVIGNANILERKLHELSHLKTINRITTSAYQASSHANQLLAYAESAPEYMQDHDMIHILHSLSETWKQQLPEDIQLHIKLPQYLPTCHCDNQKIQHVLNILFENAVEACQPSGLIVVQASAEYLQHDMPERHLKKGDYIKISIQDNGVGIKNGEIGKIFEPFFSNKFTGRGLGLPAAHGIIKQHGGTIHVQSNEGQGAIFTVFLPTLSPPTPSSSA